MTCAVERIAPEQIAFFEGYLIKLTDVDPAKVLIWLAENLPDVKPQVTFTLDRPTRVNVRFKLGEEEACVLFKVFWQ